MFGLITTVLPGKIFLMKTSNKSEFPYNSLPLYGSSREYIVKFPFCLPVILLICWFPAALEAQAVAADTADLFADWRNRVLQIQVIEKQSQSKSGIGSGFLAGPSRFVFTNYHVIADLANHPGEYEARYLSESGEQGKLELVNVDVVHDLALLRSSGQHPAPLAIVEQVPRQGTRLLSVPEPG